MWEVRFSELGAFNAAPVTRMQEFDVNKLLRVAQKHLRSHVIDIAADALPSESDVINGVVIVGMFRTVGKFTARRLPE